MFRSSPRRFTILLLLALAFVAPWQATAEAAGQAASPGWQTWEVAAQLWNAFLGLWKENGCLVDPSGACGAGSRTEHGCSQDPNGRCASGAVTAATEAGCLVDPNGRCAGGGAGSAATMSDHGCSGDPNGVCGH